LILVQCRRDHDGFDGLRPLGLDIESLLHPQSLRHVDAAHHIGRRLKLEYNVSC
jgi:hypothetical protein